jgi:putative ABC transport system substrate-binding protein
MDRRAFLHSFALGLLAATVSGEGQQPAGKIYRVGLLAGLDPAGATRFLGRFFERLRQLGYIEGKNLMIESRYAHGKFERFPGFAAELVRLNVDVIVASVDAAAVAAREATRTIPVVTVAVGDPVALGLIASLARPGGNITGLTTLSVDLSAKQLELLKEAIPGVTRVAVLWDPGNPGMALQMRETQAAAKSLGLELQTLGARTPDEFDRAFVAIAKERPGALLVLADPLFFTVRTKILDLAAKNRLPAVHGFREFTEAGGLMSYGVDLPDNYRRAATYVDRILKGTKPADLPVEQPTKFELVINMRTARALGLSIPPSVLVRADALIQ